MTRDRSRSVVVAVAALLVLLVGATGPALAQANATSTPTTDSETETVVAQVDEDIRVTDYEYRENSSVFAVTLQNVGRSTSGVTITEAIQSDETGAGRFGIEQVNIHADETLTVEVSVNPEPDTHGVMITTRKSVANGEGTYLQVREDGASLFSGSPTWNTVRFVYLVGAGAILIALVVGVWWLVSARHDGAQEIDLDPDVNLLGGLRNE